MSSYKKLILKLNIPGFIHFDLILTPSTLIIKTVSA